MQNNVYDKLKYINMIALPALATFVIGLDAFYDIGDATKEAGVIVLLNTLLGALLGRSSKQYQGAGDLIVSKDTSDGEVYTSADFNKHPDHLKDGQNITLNVKRVTH